MQAGERMRNLFTKLEAFSSKYLLRQEFYAVLLFLCVGIVALLFRGGNALWYSLFPERSESVVVRTHVDSVFTALSMKKDSLHFWNPGEREVAVQPRPHVTQKAASLSRTSVALNHASPEELEQLPGIGGVMSKRIVDYRELRGGFRSLDELMNVAGIGPKKYEQMRPYLRLD